MRSKNNALKHGIFAKTVVLKTESRADFDNLLNRFQEYFDPVGAVEATLVEKLALLFWRHRRVMAAEVTAIEERTAGGAMGYWRLSPEATDSVLRYEASIERAIERTLSQLERLQRTRKGQAVLPAIKVDVSS